MLSFKAVPWLPINLILLSSLTLLVSTESKASSVQLSDEQQAILEQYSPIPYCIDPAWRPIEWIQSGKHHGISANYMRLLSDKLEATFTLVPTDTWQQSLDYLQQGKCLLVPMLGKSKTRESQFLFSKSYFEGVNVFVTRLSVSYIEDIQQLYGRKLAVAKSYATTQYLKDEHPNIQLIEKNTIGQALIAVATGQADAAVSNLQVAADQIAARGLTNIKIAGSMPLTNSMHMAVNPAHAELIPLFNLALDSITPLEHGKATEEWQHLKFDYQFDYTPLLYILVAVLASGLLMAFHYVSIRKVNLKLTSANHLLEIKQNELKRVAEQDPLTKIANRKKLDEVLGNEKDRADRYQTPFSVMIFDIDHFKSINDNHGHLTGDQVLVEFSQLIAELTRSTDVFGRWGGEEFLLICPETDFQDAVIVAEKALAEIRHTPFANGLTLTCSVGLSQYNPKELITECLSRVDKALYRAKKAGRDRLCCSPLN